MSQAYSDPNRASDPYALPDIEVFYVSKVQATMAVAFDQCDGRHCELSGWYWWPCFPGCLPDGDPVGPFASEAEALADSQDMGVWENDMETRTLIVTIEASTQADADYIIEALARVACDITNSLDDDNAHILIHEPNR